jgi:sugar transferase EpsL
MTRQQGPSSLRSTFYRRHGKRVLDLVVTASVLPLLVPVLGLVALAVRFRLGSPTLFRQERSGLHGKPFTLWKFRTMTEARDARGNLLPDVQRLTPLGVWLRSTSLDELPELFNVLRGEMSLVGPRPLFTKYLPYYSEEERTRFLVLPGITGWAQISGRNNSPWNERLARDVWYVENLSERLDLAILWRTLSLVWRREDIQVAPRVTMLDLDEERSPDVS